MRTQAVTLAIFATSALARAVPPVIAYDCEANNDDFLQCEDDCDVECDAAEVHDFACYYSCYGLCQAQYCEGVIPTIPTSTVTASFPDVTYTATVTASNPGNDDVTASFPEYTATVIAVPVPGDE